MAAVPLQEAAVAFLEATVACQHSTLETGTPKGGPQWRNLPNTECKAKIIILQLKSHEFLQGA